MNPDTYDPVVSWVFVVNKKTLFGIATLLSVALAWFFFGEYAAFVDNAE